MPKGQKDELHHSGGQDSELKDQEQEALSQAKPVTSGHS